MLLQTLTRNPIASPEVLGISSGVALMLVADWLGRYLIFPYEIGAGVLASLLGGGYFLLHLRQPQP